MANGSIFKRLLIGVGIALTLSTAVLAQWSIGKPGTREAPKAKRHYITCEEAGTLAIMD